MSALSQSLIFTQGTQTTVVVNYPNSGISTIDYYSNKLKGEGYFNGGDGLHTAMVTCSPQFVGTVTMQATLASEPTSTDWFDIDNTSVNYTDLNYRTTSTVNLFNFVGNFVWVRGKIQIDSGSVLNIQYNH